ncbi:hypothetical protein DDE83_002711 [Stemphylium lycopersici]|uniref:Uncharacterized protein n=1 Tax=Stemphylium lycopersici TaxID=183478 RepID=A0A364N9J6_STELY|nr:hypothetical protein DDE83_002711 [Stemphylium lycopersici]
MANTIGYHHVERSIPRKPQQGRVNNMPPQANIVAAASRIRQLFESKRFAYSIMGGLQMFCLGNEREVSDLHIAYDDRDFSRIRKKLEADRRVQLPEGMNPLVASRILIETGPSYQDIGCTRSATVEVNLLPPGSCGTPPSGMLNDNVVLLSHKVGGMLKTFKGLNMLYLVRTLVQFCNARDLNWNPQQDILFVCQHYGGQIQSVRSQLDQKAIHQNFLHTTFFAGLSSEDQRRCYQILAGQALPQPAATSLPVPHNSHFHSQPNPIVPRARVVSHNSTFAPTTHSSHGFQGPRQLQKDGPFLKHAANVGLPHTNLSSDPQFISESTVSAKDSRSRYRPMSNLNSRRTGSFNPQISSLSTKRAINGPNSHPKALSQPSNTHAMPTNQLDSDTRLRTASHSALITPSTTAKDGQSRPHVDTARAQALYHPRESGNPEGNLVPQRPQNQHHMSMFEMSATPTPPDARQGHGPAQVEPASKPATSRLQIVGPEGVHQLPPPSTKPSPALQPNTIQAPPPPLFELATSSPQDKDIIASLSADIDAAIQTSNNNRLASTPTPVQNSAVRRRPLHPRAVSAPLAMLPVSLIPGYGGGSGPITPPAYGGGGGGGGEGGGGGGASGGGIGYYTTPSEGVNEQAVQVSRYGDAPVSPPLTPAPLAVYKAYQTTSQPQSRSMPASPLPRAARLVPVSCSPPDSTKGVDSQGWCGVEDVEYKCEDILQQVQAEIERSLDAGMLAMEYRAELPEFEDGYGGGYGEVR